MSQNLARLQAIIAERSFSCGAIFKLSSGIESNLYFNMKPTMLHAEGGALLAKAALAKISGMKADLVGGLELGAVPIATSMAVLSHGGAEPVSAFIVRKKPKEYGARAKVEGLVRGDSLKGKRIVILDDVCTTGAAALQAVEEAKLDGAEVLMVLALVDREEGAAQAFAKAGIRFEALFKASAFIPAGFERLPKIA